MSIKVIGIGGLPASGKSTLMVNVMKRLGAAFDFKYGTVRGHSFFDAKCIVLGLYGDGAFQGTDKLSMSVQPQAVKVLRKMMDMPAYNGYTILFEGDRLFTPSLIDEVKRLNISNEFFILTVSEKELRRRHEQRRDTQTETWLRGRETKYKNLADNHKLIELINETSIQSEANAQMIVNKIQEYREYASGQPTSV